MSRENDGLQGDQNRLLEIQKEAGQLNQSISASVREVQLLVEKAVEELRKVRVVKSDLADLRAETTYLRLSRGIVADEPEVPETPASQFEPLWKELKVMSQPVRASKEWLEKIKGVEKRSPNPILTTEEQLELERRLKENVCPLCVSYALDGTCTIQSFEKCPIDTYLDRLVKMIDEMGHQPWMEDYFDRMYRDICPGCAGRVNEDHCPPKEEGECAIFTYLPTIVRTVEDFMKEKKETENRPS